ncbi:GNAT family N-acetyltransferase [Caldibacillus lycopersici]|uniref:GNAT family N-acetyltransferase n=1 Tax=Perspicuibacillus lycopersici TaxID=1325689 RepID=A0AAE3LNT1_9BACI|nr:GNAT family N-acetyltransferase [Perspicuibacillus lycopersici]MCU9614231.1 GNAT family N-acetyltransferase [Perspicuibacillus lycopersici]
MEHKKTYYKREWFTKNATVIIEGPISSEELASYQFHDGLSAFRPPQEQREALIGIADLDEGRIIIARVENIMIGYVTFLYPDPLERWSESNMENLLELGAIEVAAPFRGLSIGKQLLQVSMLDDAMEDYIIITTEYYWHWDLKGTGLNVWEYRKIMEKMMGAGGLVWYATDDPEICSHPANCLMARIGNRVDRDSIEKFDRIRFINRFMY